MENLIANAGNHADIGVVKNMFIGVGQALSVFVRKAGIRLFANKGRSGTGTERSDGTVGTEIDSDHQYGR
ncbi:hypothetical protein DMI70_12225 [Escherichia coli]|nr:hypothetical protein [Escherichia coli]